MIIEVFQWYCIISVCYGVLLYVYACAQDAIDYFMLGYPRDIKRCWNYSSPIIWIYCAVNGIPVVNVGLGLYVIYHYVVTKND